MRWLVVAGDRREVEAAAHLAVAGYEVALLGDSPGAGVEAVHDPERAFALADAVLGPALGTNAVGDAFQRPAPQAALPIESAWLKSCRRGTPWVVGRAGPRLVSAASELGLPLHTYADRDEFALRNAVPTAEGAIAEAARRSGRTAWGTAALVIGGGRCARALVGRLCALGARVLCAARSPAARAECEALGAGSLPLECLPAAATRSLWLFNTVPAPVVGPGVLARLPAGATVIDIASAPGGTDFAAAAALGVDAALVPAIPGRMFPRTAGRIVAETAMELLGVSREEVADRGRF